MALNLEQFGLKRFSKVAEAIKGLGVKATFLSREAEPFKIKYFGSVAPELQTELTEHALSLIQSSPPEMIKNMQGINVYGDFPVGRKILQPHTSPYIGGKLKAKRTGGIVGGVTVQPGARMSLQDKLLGRRYWTPKTYIDLSVPNMRQMMEIGKVNGPAVARLNESYQAFNKTMESLGSKERRPLELPDLVGELHPSKDYFKNILTHEWGHALHFHYGTEYSDYHSLLGGIPGAVLSYGPNGFVLADEAIPSKYGASNSYEHMAESYLSGKLNPQHPIFGEIAARLEAGPVKKPMGPIMSEDFPLRKGKRRLRTPVMNLRASRVGHNVTFH